MNWLHKLENFKAPAMGTYSGLFGTKKIEDMWRVLARDYLKEKSKVKDDTVKAFIQAQQEKLNGKFVPPEIQWEGEDSMFEGCISFY